MVNCALATLHLKHQINFLHSASQAEACYNKPHGQWRGTSFNTSLAFPLAIIFLRVVEIQLVCPKSDKSMLHPPQRLCSRRWYPRGGGGGGERLKTRWQRWRRCCGWEGAVMELISVQQGYCTCSLTQKYLHAWVSMTISRGQTSPDVHYDAYIWLWLL